MGRREQPLPPGPLHDFAADLRSLRASTGLTYRELAVKAGYSYSALSAAAKGEVLPTLDLTLAYVGACGGDMAPWEDRWRALAAELRRTHPGLVSDAPPNAEASPPVDPPASTREDALAPLTDTDPVRAGRITIAARLGAGSMGQVYLGRTDAGAPAAVKMVRPELAADPVFRRRFRRELDALRDIDSPYTAPLIDADPEAQRPWLASGYCPAVSLAEAVDTHGPLPPPVVARLAGGVATALIAIHAAGIVHRDLKPANVLLTTDGLCVIDFGIAAAVEGTALTVTGTQLGSAAYMAPEQASGAETDRAADVFALGALLVYALTANPPFGEGRAAAVLYRVVHEAPDLTGLAALTGADDLRAVVEACLDKNPDARPTPEQLLGSYGLAELPGPGWLPDTVVADIIGHTAAATAALATLADSAGDQSATHQSAVPIRRTNRRARRRVLRIGLVTLVLAIVATVIVVSRSADVQQQPAAAGLAPLPRHTGTTTKQSTTATSIPSATTTSSSRPAAPQGAVPTHPATGAHTNPGVAVAPLVTFTALTGEDCPQDSTKGVYDSGSSAWDKHTGGWTGDGCTGQYVAAKVNDSSDGNNTFTWWFATGSVPNGLCDVQVYVPAGGSLAGGNPAYYQLYNGQLDTSDQYYVTTFTVYQASNQGTWQDAGSFPTRDGYLDVRLTNQGSGSHDVAAQAIRIACHP